ncbi:hypothetical protein [Solidesulfovibrio sp.]|uniref:hypothetical protein n=1 Tax=Solidesulfovibrio sp. TaxID=2910990 RepID=UPI002B21CB7D|nr:hypothetical protein [Solidesulfovibrio sp.]MEA5087276.1 hypothetical protein [Solidesulfovibrio sp.]
MSAGMETATARASRAWGELPDWVASLAAACEATSGRVVAGRLGVSPAAVSRVLGNSYGDTAAMERRVREGLMAAVVVCPVVGEIAVEACREHQARPWTPVNPLCVRLYRECRQCPHREEKHAGQ